MFTTVYFELSLGHTNGGILGLGGIPCFVLSLRVTLTFTVGFLLLQGYKQCLEPTICVGSRTYSVFCWDIYCFVLMHDVRHII